MNMEWKMRENQGIRKWIHKSQQALILEIVMIDGKRIYALYLKGESGNYDNLVRTYKCLSVAKGAYKKLGVVR